MNFIKQIKTSLYCKMHMDYIKFDYNKKKNRLKINCPHSFEDRALKTTQMLCMALEYAKPNLKGNLHLSVCCEDFPAEKYNSKRIRLAYTKLPSDNKTLLIPDFCFMNWKESGLDDYEKITAKLVENSKKDPVYNTLFWIGNAKTHPSRETLCQLGEKDNRIEAVAMGWTKKDNKSVPNKFVSLPDQVQYKYLIDVQGRGYSGRTKILMFSGRPLFIADRKWNEFWNEKAEPFVHYIPVKEDLSDLLEKLDWAESHAEDCHKIAMNAQQFATEHLSRKAAIEYLSELLVKCSGN